ncbi:hypothetical protein [Actinoplanes subglobosus]|uniref:Acyl-CoA synthetase n=1 Tax=Actinoplanes subglobosus TaxID=1547892 RepID=A0ABV8IR45_9ACTN
MGETRSPWTGPGRIGRAADVRATLALVARAAEQRATTGALAHAVQTGDDAELVSLDLTRIAPAVNELLPLLPWPGGLRRGASIAAVGSVTVLQVLLAGAMRDGSWAAVVGMPDFGMVAAAEAGIPLDRLALVPDPGPDWPSIVAALLDGVAAVAVHTPGPVTASVARALQARARSRDSILIATQPWPGTDLTLEATGRSWTGLGAGRGRLRRQHLDLRASGRGAAARPRSGALAWPPTPSQPAQIPPPPAPSSPGQAAPAASGNALWEPRPADPPPDDPWRSLRVPGQPPRRSTARRGGKPGSGSGRTVSA